MNVRLFVLCLSTFAIGPCVGQDATEPPEPTCGHGCMNGAQCTWPGYGEDYYCVCPEGYTGRFCETEIPNCNDGDMCYNGGQCIEEEGEYYCKCDHPYTGYQCETEMKDCSSGEEDSMCQNGGVCNEDGEEAWCECQHPFTGYQCETMMSPCESCHPTAEACYEAPCECKGDCRDLTMCVACIGRYDSDCGAPSEERMDGVTVAQCPHGCKTENGMHHGAWYVKRGCAEEMCWSGCNDERECKKCCEGEYCNGAPMEHHTNAASTLASRVGAIVAIATFGFLVLV